MKRLLVTACEVVLSVAFLCVPAGAQAAKQDILPSQDLLINK